MSRGAVALAVLLLGAACGGVEVSERPIRATGPATLLFAASENGGGWEIYVEDVESGRRTDLTRTPPSGRIEADDRSPALSHDAKLIAFTSTADHMSDGAVDEEIFVMERDGGKPLRLTNDDDADVEPQWTPDGRIVFTTCPSSQEGLAVCRLDAITPDGSGRETLLDDLGLASGVALSPGGDRVAYSRYDETLRPLGIFVRTIGREEGEAVADGAGAQWSPDAERIAFLSARDRNGPCLFDCTGSAPELYVMDADGSDQTRLTETIESEAFVSWTPDGEWLLVSRIRDEEDDYDVFAIRPDGSCEVKVTDTDAWEWSPTWIGPTESLSC